MANPIFTHTPAFNGSNQTSPQPGYQQYGQPGSQYSHPYGQGSGYAPPTAGELSAMYGAPAASPVQTGRLTYDDVLVKTVGMFAVLLVGATVGWLFAPMFPGMIFIAMLAGIVLGIVNWFKKQPSPALITTYSAVEGLFIGCISMVFNSMWDGIVVQAVVATLAVFGVTLALFASGKIRASAKATRIFLIASIGYVIFSLINLGLMWTGAVNDPWGLRGSITLMGIPLGVIIGIVAVLLAAYSLVIDFDAIQRGVRNGAPARFAWKAAFALVFDLVWLYLEILRILAIFRDN
ncbi:MAG: Bax inhibitor-1/YccA family protein [Bifidobacteriaceae bacterium]|nr:Bax inhibitor-1/YccA family protein [Bifidobacteriaceae bacterium]